MTVLVEQGLHFENDMAVLTVATGLPLKLAFGFDCVCNRFLVCYSGLANSDVDTPFLW